MTSEEDTSEEEETGFKTYVNRPSEAIDSEHPVHRLRENRHSTFYTTEEGNPTGGFSRAEGISIVWQNGVQEANGAILEDVLALAVDRLQFFQGELPEQGGPMPPERKHGKFRSRENSLVITHLQEAIHWLNHRTIERRRRGVEGSYSV